VTAGGAGAVRGRAPRARARQVRATAVAVLRRAEDEELRGVLLQLVQALRYEPGDDSRLAALLVQRAARQPTIAIPLHWCARRCARRARRTRRPRLPADLAGARPQRMRGSRAQAAVRTLLAACHVGAGRPPVPDCAVARSGPGARRMVIHERASRPGAWW
jgi:hypothetical protein